MNCWKVVKGSHKLKLKRIGDQDAGTAPEEQQPMMVIRHKVRLKPPKYLKRLLSLWL